MCIYVYTHTHAYSFCFHFHFSSDSSVILWERLLASMTQAERVRGGFGHTPHCLKLILCLPVSLPRASRAGSCSAFDSQATAELAFAGPCARWGAEWSGAPRGPPRGCPGRHITAVHDKTPPGGVSTVRRQLPEPPVGSIGGSTMAKNRPAGPLNHSVLGRSGRGGCLVRPLYRGSVFLERHHPERAYPSWGPALTPHGASGGGGWCQQA